MENLNRRGGQTAQDENSKKAREQLAERKDALADSVSGLQQDIEQSARAQAGAGTNGQRTARQLKEAADQLARERVADRIREGKKGLQGQQPGPGKGEESAIERSLNGIADRLQAAEQSARGAGASNGEEALDRTKQLADTLDSMRRRMEDNASRQNRNGQQGQGQSQGQQQGQQGSKGQQGQGQQQGQEQGQGQQQGGSQSGGPTSGQASGNRQYGGPSWGPTGSDWGDNRQLPAEIRERLREAQDLRRDLGPTGLGAGRLDEVIDDLKRMADGKMEGDAATAASLKADVVEPLRQLELELSRRLQQQSARTNLRLRDEGAAPEKYRKAVEEYYRRLSGGKARQ